MTNSTPRLSLYFGWYVAAACLFIGFVTVGARQAVGVFVVPMSEDFGWDRTTISSAVALGVLVNGLTQPLMGYLFDRSGVRVIVASLIVVGLATASLALTFHILFLAFMFGIVASAALSGASSINTGALLARWFRRRRGTVVGLNGAGSSLGGLVLVPFAAYLIQATSWRASWTVLGLIILALSVPLAFMFLRDDPGGMGLRPDGDPDPRQSGAAGPSYRARGPLETGRWTKSFRSSPIWQISAAYFVCGCTTSVISFHFVAYAEEDVGVSAITAAWAFSFMMLLNVLGNIGAGILADRFRRKNVLAIGYFFRGCAYIALLAMPSTTGLWAFATLAGVSWGATAVVTKALTADVYGVRALGTISGISFGFHQLGGALSVLLAGVLKDVTGSYTVPFAIVGSLLFPAALSAFTIKEHKYSTRYQAQSAPAAAG
jgi:sugar phosphate permease